MKKGFILLLVMFCIMSISSYVCASDEDEYVVFWLENHDKGINSTWSEGNLMDYNFIRIYAVYSRQEKFLYGGSFLRLKSPTNMTINTLYSCSDTQPHSWVFSEVYEMDEFVTNYNGGRENYLGMSLTDGYGVEDAIYDNTLIVTLHEERPLEFDFEYIPYKIIVDNMGRGRSWAPPWPAHYYYHANIMPVEEGKEIIDGWVLGKLHSIDNLYIGDPWWGKEYKSVFELDRFNFCEFWSGEGIANVLKADEWLDELRFVFVPYDYHYRKLAFAVRFDDMGGIFDSALIDSEDERFQLPDDVGEDDYDIYFNENNHYYIGEQDKQTATDVDGIMRWVKEYWDMSIDKVSDIIEIFVAFRNAINKQFQSQDWDGIMVNMTDTRYPLQGEYYVVAPGPINKVRVGLRTMISGCMYFVTAMMVIRKARDIF